MEFRIELFLRDQVIVGDLYATEERVLDRFNDRRKRDMIVHHPSSRSLDGAAEPRVLTSARVRKRNVLLVIPDDVPTPRGAPRGGLWVEKRQVAVELGVGPFVLGGMLHHSLHEPLTLDETDQDSDGRDFIPITQASLRFLQAPAWSRECPALLVLRSAIDYLCLLVGRGQN